VKPRSQKPRAPSAPRRRRDRSAGRPAPSTTDLNPTAAAGESEMTVIPFNVPGLPEPEVLSGRFIFKPVSIDTGDIHAGPRVALRSGSRSAAVPDWHSDGVMCIYPEIETIAHLFNASLRGRHGEPVPAMVVTSQSTDGLCTIFGFGQSEGHPQLTVNILPDEHLPTILGRDRDSAVDVGRISERLEITQTFAANSFGVLSRIANEVTNMPKPGHARRGGDPVFNLYDDTASIADVCSFYLSRALTLVDDRYGGRAVGVNMMGGPDSIWQLLWRPTTFRCIAAFATVFVLTRLSVSVSRARGETNFALDYNRSANWPDRGSDKE
jgi:hypothetical protein